MHLLFVGDDIYFRYESAGNCTISLGQIVHMLISARGLPWSYRRLDCIYVRPGAGSCVYGLASGRSRPLQEFWPDLYGTGTVPLPLPETAGRTRRDSEGGSTPAEVFEHGPYLFV